jgi:hypothetical protein
MTIKNIIRSGIFILAGFVIASCTKEVPKEMQNQQKPQTDQNQQQQQMPKDDVHKNVNKDQTSAADTSAGGDKKAAQLTKEADDADAQYQKTKADEDKMTCISKQLAAANYLTFEAELSPKKKYKPALQRYRRVLELDPANAEALKNKKQIEDIYESMGMPIPN